MQWWLPRRTESVVQTLFLFWEKHFRAFSKYCSNKSSWHQISESMFRKWPYKHALSNPEYTSHCIRCQPYLDWPLFRYWFTKHIKFLVNLGFFCKSVPGKSGLVKVAFPFEQNFKEHRQSLILFLVQTRK
jgi:hypothetical protein